MIPALQSRVKRRVWSSAALAFGFGFACLALIRTTNSLVYNLQNGRVDFGYFYHSAQCIVSGCDRQPNLNPPFVHWLFVPFVALPLATATTAWMAILLGCAAMASARIVHAVRLPAEVSIVLFPALAASHIVQFTIVTGQLSPVLLLPLTWLWASERVGGRHLNEDWWLPVLVAWKPMLALPAVGRTIRTPRRLALLLVGVGAILAADVAVEGIDVYSRWLLALQRWKFPGNEFDGSIWQWTTRICGPQSPVGRFYGCADLEWPLAAAGAVGICAVTVWRMHSSPSDRAWLLGLSGALIASPKGWCYYGIWLVGPAIGVWANGSTLARALLIAALTLGLTPHWGLVSLGQPSPWASATVGSAFFWMYLCCWAAALLPDGLARTCRFAGTR